VTLAVDFYDLRMAEESIRALNKLKGIEIWSTTTTYYIFYYSLYSLMMRIGVKCEIHSCSLEFMKHFLSKFYDERDVKMINKAFNARIDLQYYPDRPVDKRDLEEIKKYCKHFFIKTKDILSLITEDDIGKLRKNLKDFVF
jgi:uncharacterized protein (UPF0332 family)